MNQATKTTAQQGERLLCPVPFVLPQNLRNTERYVGLLSQSAREYPEAFGFRNGFTPSDAHDARERFMGYGIVTLACEDLGGELIGAVSYRLVDDTNRLQMAYLCRLKRVRDLAIGQLLFRSVLMEARRNGGNAVSFDVMQKNAHALGMYRAAGVETTETYRSQFYPSEPLMADIEGETTIINGITYLTEQIMEKNL